MAMTDVTGSDNQLYDFPPGTACFADLADGMSFNRASILKSVLRWGEKDGTEKEYDLAKIIWYANREMCLLQTGRTAQSDVAPELEAFAARHFDPKGLGL